jgi:hypothetical protein
LGLNRGELRFGEERRRSISGCGVGRNGLRSEKVERLPFQSGDTGSHLILPHSEQVLIHLGLRFELLVDDQALRDRLLSQAVAGFAQSAEITPQRIERTGPGELLMVCVLNTESLLLRSDLC